MENIKIGVQVDSSGAIKGLDQVGNKIKSMANNAKNAAGKGLNNLNNKLGSIGNKISSLTPNLGSMGGKISGISSQMGNFGTVLGSTAGAVGGLTLALGAAVLGMKKLADSTAQMADNVGKASQRMGVSIEFYQKMGSAAQHAGTSIGTMERAMRSMLLKMTQVEQGNKTASEAFERLGVATHDVEGNMRNQERVFSDTLIALSKMENATKRNALAQEVLGRNASELVPLLNEGEEALRKYIYANESAVTVSQELVDASTRYNDQMQTLKETFDGAINEALTPFMETMAGVAETFSTEQIQMFGESVGLVFSGILKAGSLLATGINAIFSSVEFAINKVVEGAFKAVEEVNDFIATQAESWSTILSLVGVEFEWLDKLADDARAREDMYDNAKKSAREMADEQLLAANERQTLLLNYVKGISNVTKKQKDLNNETSGLNDELKSATITLQDVSDKIASLYSFIRREDGGGIFSAVSLTKELTQLRELKKEYSAITQNTEDLDTVIGALEDRAVDKWFNKIGSEITDSAESIPELTKNLNAVAGILTQFKVLSDGEYINVFDEEDMARISSLSGKFFNKFINEHNKAADYIMSQQSLLGLSLYSNEQEVDNEMRRMRQDWRTAMDEGLLTKKQFDDLVIQQEQYKNERLRELRQEDSENMINHITSIGQQSLSIISMVAGSIQQLQAQKSRNEEVMWNKEKKKREEDIKNMKVNASKKEQLLEQLDAEDAARKRKAFDKEKKARKSAVIMNTASAIMGAWSSVSNLPFPANVIAGGVVSGVITGFGIAQIAAINKEQSAFREGGVVGGFTGATDGPDNVMANVRTGEMILNARQQRNLFTAINSGAVGSSGELVVNRGDIIIQGNVTEDNLDAIRQVDDEFLFKLRDGLETLNTSGELSFAL